MLAKWRDVGACGKCHYSVPNSFSGVNEKVEDILLYLNHVRCTLPYTVFGVRYGRANQNTTVPTPKDNIVTK